MPRPTSLAAILITTVWLALPGFGQQGPRQVPVPGRIKDAGVFHVATGEWTRVGQDYGLLAQNALYRNDFHAFYLGAIGEETTLFDEGRLPGDGQALRVGQPETGTHDVYLITGYQFGYCALSSNPVTYTLTFREAYKPCGNPANYPVATTLVHEDLPNNGCWVVAFDLTGTTLAFELAAEGGDGSWDHNDALDDFGYSIHIDNDQGGVGGPVWAGPILAGNCTPSLEGNGTLFRNPTLKGTGLGTSSLTWFTSPAYPKGGCWFGDCMYYDYQMVLFGEGVDVDSFCSPGNANSVSAGGATLTTTGGFGTGSASFVVTDTPDQFGVLFTGPDQTQMPFGCGVRCVSGSGIVRNGPYLPTGNTVSPTIDMSVSGNSSVQWWYRDPAHAAVCGTSFNLSNALGM